jgi:hypothetical protein
MTNEDRRARVLELFDVVINGRDMDAIPRFTVNPHIDGTLRSLLTAFSDLRFEVRWMVAEGRRVVAFVDMSGTHDSAGARLGRLRGQRAGRVEDRPTQTAHVSS